jgi:hypothetical protein
MKEDQLAHIKKLDKKHTKLSNQIHDLIESAYKTVSTLEEAKYLLDQLSLVQCGAWHRVQLRIWINDFPQDFEKLSNNHIPVITDDEMIKLKRLDKQWNKVFDDAYNFLKPIVEEAMADDKLGLEFCEQTLNMEICGFEKCEIRTALRKKNLI